MLAKGLGLPRGIGAARLVGLVVLAAAIAVKAANPAMFESLQLRTFDTFQQLKPRHQDAPLPVTIVDLDEKSLATLGQWPWPRTLVADLVDRLMAEGVAAIAFDIVFAEPDRLSPGHYADLALDLPLAVREELKSRQSNDESFAKSLRRARVVLGQVGVPTTIAQMSPRRAVLRRIWKGSPVCFGISRCSTRPRPDAACFRCATISIASCGGCPSFQ
jgi:adenylate cyclase